MNNLEQISLSKYQATLAGKQLLPGRRMLLDQPAQLLADMNAANADRQYYKANLGEKDMWFIIAAAKSILGN